MKTIFERSKVQLNKVEEACVNFLSSRGFTFHVKKRDNTVEIEGSCSIKNDHKGFVKITLRKEYGKFIIDFKTPMERNPMLDAPSLLTMFGFGFLFRKKADLYDFYNKLEDEFWQYIDKVCLC